jgi:hypothetical protein
MYILRAPPLPLWMIASCTAALLACLRLKTTGYSSRQRSTVIARGHSMARSAQAFRRLENAHRRFSRWAKVGV